MTDKMAEFLSTTAWLQEGLWLKDIIVRLAGPTLVQSYIETRDACRHLPWPYSGGRPLAPEKVQRSARRDELYQACIAPLVEAFNSGRIIAARPDHCSSKFVPMLPPATGWDFRVFDLEKSLICHPQKAYGSLFVLFRFADRKPVMKLEPVKNVGPNETTGPRRESSRSSTKEWLMSAVQKFPPDDRKHGWKKHYTKKLAAIMVEEAKTNKKLKPCTSESIAARLNEYDLWPK